MNCAKDENGLKLLYERMESALEEDGMLVVVDDISALLWSGFEPMWVARFITGLKAMITKVSIISQLRILGMTMLPEQYLFSGLL